MPDKEKKPMALEDLTVNEVSMVMNPANPDAHVTLFKFAEEADLAKGQFNDVLDAVELEEQVRTMMRPMWDYSEALQLSFRQVLQDGTVKDKIAALKDCVGEFAIRLKKEIGQIKLSTKKSANETHGGKLHKEDVDMSEEQTAKTFDQSAVDKMVGEAVEKALGDAGVEELKILAKMSDAEKEHLEKLEDQPRADFLKMDSDSRQSLIEKAVESDEVLETSDGTIRKSEVGASTFALLKSSQERIEKAEKMAAEERDIRLKKEHIQKAETEWPHLPGTPEEKGAVAKAVSGLPEDVAKTITTMLKQAESNVVNLFKIHGSSGSLDSGDDSVGKLDALAKAYAKEHDLTYTTAYGKVLGTEEGRSLYAESEAEKKKA